MAEYPSVTGRAVVRALQKLGFQVRRSGKGSHVILGKAGLRTHVAVPIHAGCTLPEGTLHSILKQAGLTKAQLYDALD